MNRVALAMLMGDRLKYFGLTFGIAFATLLIVQQLSILVGLASQTGAFIRDTSHADLWVMDPQVRFSQDPHALRDTMVSRVRSVKGVHWALPLYQAFLKARLADGTRTTAILVGIDDATLMGGPPEMIRGALADLRRDKAVIIDHDAAPTKLRYKQRGDGHVDVGHRFDINDNEVEVVGTYRGSRSFFWDPVIYTTYSRAISMAPPERRLLSFVLVKCAPGEDAAEVARRIEETTGLKARTNDDFIGLTSDYILHETGILINFGMAVALGFIVGLLVCGQMLYNFTVDSLRAYGALKAMGATSGRLIAMVFVQVLSVGGIGYGLGLGGACLMGVAMGDSGLGFRMTWHIPVAGAVGILSICLIAALLSLTRVLRLEPAVVFKV